VAIHRRTGRSRLTLVLLVLISIIILTLDFRDVAFVQGTRDAVGNALAPVRRAAESAFEPVGNAWNGITDYGDLKAENDRLRAELEELRGTEALDEAAAEQLEELLRQEDIGWIGDIPEETARVIAGPSSNFVHTIDIDKGTSHGIREGMRVITGNGLLGRVVQTTGSRATVQTISDPDLKVGVRLARLGSLGTARGQGDGEPMLVDVNISAEDEDSVPTNLLVTTSGTDLAAFPRDIPVGRVLSARPAPNGLSLDLVLDPLVDVTELSYVKVLRWEPPE
jgi:rod shape-determining protein MreC